MTVLCTLQSIMTEWLEIRNTTENQLWYWNI